MAKRMEIFISSTSQDLTIYRDSVKDVILRLGHYPIVMEAFNPTDRNALQKCYDELQQAEVFIGIYAYRYGYVPGNNTLYTAKDGTIHSGDQKTSITHWEYIWANERNLPMLLFIVSETDENGVALNWSTDFVEEEPGKSRIEELKRLIKANHTVGFFHSPDHLGLQIATGLAEVPKLPIEAFREDASKSDFLEVVTGDKYPSEFIESLIFDGRHETWLRINALNYYFHTGVIDDNFLHKLLQDKNNEIRNEIIILIEKYKIAVPRDIIATMINESGSVEVAKAAIELASTLIERGYFSSEILQLASMFKAGRRTWEVTGRAIAAIIRADDQDSFSTLLHFKQLTYHVSIKDVRNYLERLYRENRLSEGQLDEAINLLNGYASNPKCTEITIKNVKKTIKILQSDKSTF